MKKIILLLVVSIILMFPHHTSAHMVGQPPFFRINGAFTLPYPIPTSSVPDFLLPQDIADKNFLVDEPLEMDMDLAQLPILPEIIDQTTFLWDFGDGSRGEGLKNSHIYTKTGSYFLTVEAKYRNDEPQLIQSTLVHILPDANYKLPQAKIMVDGKESKDPLTDTIGVDFKQNFLFDADKSFAQGKIVEYHWDLGDGKSSKEKKLDYRYDPESMQVFPVLRVKDDMGFIADAYVELGDQNVIDTHETDEESKSMMWYFIVLVIVVFIGGVIWFINRRSKK